MLLIPMLENSFTATKHFVSKKEIAGQNHFYAIFDVIFVQIQLTRFSVHFGAYFMPVTVRQGCIPGARTTIDVTSLSTG
jgi:hypothetical protein